MSSGVVTEGFPGELGLLFAMRSPRSGSCPGRIGNAGRGAIGGELVTMEEFEATREALAGMGIQIRRNPSLGINGNFIARQAGASIIEYGEALPNRHVFYHELGHAQQFLQLGYDRYASLTPLQRETYVVQFLNTLISPTEMWHAIEYLRRYQ
jgi:hypothetical protein